MKKAMKKAMKAMRAMKKAMKKSVVARGRGAKARVFSGKKLKTGGGLTKSDLTRNKRGKVVSKKASERSKSAYASSGLKQWTEPVLRVMLLMKTMRAMKAMRAMKKAMKAMRAMKKAMKKSVVA